jgi:precorrin-2 dehydrogenase/sirohydrochlorin ferrochelatase
MSANPLYPIFLKLKDRLVLIIGGGAIAEQKLKGLLNTEAKLRVIAAEISPEVRALKGKFPDLRQIEFFERPYEYGDEKAAFLVIAATDDQHINNMIANRCRDQMILVNSVDQPMYCDFYVPSIIDTKSIKVAISTNGKAPAIAQKIRQDLETYVSLKYADIVDVVEEFRLKVKDKITGYDNFERRARLIRWYTRRLFRNQLRAKTNQALQAK